MIEGINEQVKPKADGLLHHPLYKKIKNPEQLLVVMEQMVFIVWSNMCLLQALQEKLTKTSTPWTPYGNPEIRYYINKLILDEESDVNPKEGKHHSKFEMYIDAMAATGANTASIKDFLSQVEHGTDIFLIIATSKLPVSLKEILLNKFQIISEGKAHKIASAYAFGRSEPATEKFHLILENFRKNFGETNFAPLQRYLDRQKKTGEEAFDLLEQLCATDEQKWSEAGKTVMDLMDKRISLCDSLKEDISQPELIE